MNHPVKYTFFTSVIVIALVVIYFPSTHHEYQQRSFSHHWSLPRKPEKPIKPAELTSLEKAVTEAQVSLFGNSDANGQFLINSQTAVMAKLSPHTVAVAQPKAWLIELNTYTSKATAHADVVTLRAQGYPAYSQHRLGHRGTSYEVVIGPFIERANLQQELLQLQKLPQKQIGTVIVYQPVDETNK